MCQQRKISTACFLGQRAPNYSEAGSGSLKVSGSRATLRHPIGARDCAFWSRATAPSPAVAKELFFLRGEHMRKLSLFMVMMLVACTARATIFTTQHPAIQAIEVGQETGGSGKCAAGGRNLVCLFDDVSSTAIRVDRMSGSPIFKGVWEPILEPDLGLEAGETAQTKFVRICIEGDCEVWPMNVFAFKTQP